LNLYATYDEAVNYWTRPLGPSTGLSAFRVSPPRKYGWEHRPSGSLSWLHGTAAGPALPTLSIGDARVTEGDAGTVAAQFTVSLSTGSSQTVTVDYATSNGTALAGSDYVAASGTVTFSPGSVQRTINVTVNGDTVVEPNESFFVTLSGPTNATLADAQGTGTIENDDTPPSTGEPVSWTAVGGVSISGSTLTKTAVTAWANAGGASTKVLASGDGYVEFTAVETNTSRLL